MFAFGRWRLDVSACWVGARTILGGFSRSWGVCLWETQEIPATFTTETGWPFGEHCRLVTSIDGKKEWPLCLRRLPEERRGVSAVSVGEGWARFMADQCLGLGALLTFEVVDERRLVVGIHRRNALTEPLAFQQLCWDGQHIARESTEQTEVHNSSYSQLSRPGALEFSGDTRPHFHKKLSKTHIKKCASSRIVSGFSQY